MEVPGLSQALQAFARIIFTASSAAPCAHHLLLLAAFRYRRKRAQNLFLKWIQQCLLQQGCGWHRQKALGLHGRVRGKNKTESSRKAEVSAHHLPHPRETVPWKKSLRPKQANSVSLWGQLQKNPQAQWNHKMSPLSIQILGPAQRSVVIVHQD